jgi:hypothetical protein
LEDFSRCINDQILLQNDLNNLHTWCLSNKLLLNPDKCCVISFFKSNQRFDSSYSLAGKDLKYVKSIRDLGVMFDEQLRFDEHVNYIATKSSKVLGMITRNCTGFTLDSLRCVYLSLVVSRLQYASIVWSPSHTIHCLTLERVQNKFLRFAAYKLGIRILDHNYSCILSQLNLVTLGERRLHGDLKFIYRLLNGQVSCPELLTSVSFAIPPRELRNYNLFHIPFHTTNYGKHSPIERTLRYTNENNIDIVGVPYSEFLKSLRRIV